MKAKEGLARRALTASQLMIGDCVKQKHSGLLLKVCAIDPPYVRADGEGGQFHEDTIEPIRITEGMLVRWGFRCDGTDAYILEQHRGVHDPSDKPYYHIKVTPPQPDNDDWWSSEDTGFEVDCDNGDMLLADQKDTYYHVLQHLLRLAELEDVVELKLEE